MQSIGIEIWLELRFKFSFSKLKFEGARLIANGNFFWVFFLFLAQSINYKINSAAPLLVPTIQPCKPAKFIVGEICEFVVVLRNPLGHNVHMSFSLPQPDESVPSWLDGVMASELVVPSSPVILLNRACAADDKVTGGPESLDGEDSR